MNLKACENGRRPQHYTSFKYESGTHPNDWGVTPEEALRGLAENAMCSVKAHATFVTLFCTRAPFATANSLAP